jgi:NitT/TauT family transport system ATP-binding protein
MQDELLALWEQERFTLLFVTHSIEEALIVGHRVLVLSPHPGRVRAELNAQGLTPAQRAAQANRIERLLFGDREAVDAISEPVAAERAAALT